MLSVLYNLHELGSVEFHYNLFYFFDIQSESGQNEKFIYYSSTAAHRTDSYSASTSSPHHHVQSMSCACQATHTVS